MYCIIDLETTGGKASQEKITEVAIIKHDGKKEVDRYSTLINPERTIPEFIVRLTGITNDMVADAPKFYEVAKDIVEFTKGCVFVAHNAKFDYSFIKTEFGRLGFTYTRKTLCTVRLARELFPGHRSYGLANLCQRFGIPLQNHHRAMADAEATAILFEHLWKKNQEKLTDFDHLKREVKTTLLPKNLPFSIYHDLPEEPGVYYMLNQNGEIVYVGKSQNIKKRISQHFQTDLKSRKGDSFKDSIVDIHYELTGNDLIAQLLESEEIKRLKPRYNVALKKKEYDYGLYHKINPSGFIELYIEKINGQGFKGHYQFGSKKAALRYLSYWAEEHALCKNYCSLMGNTMTMCIDHALSSCLGTCIGRESVEEYNERVNTFLKQFSYSESNFIIIGKGRTMGEKSIVWVEENTYRGYGYVFEDQCIKDSSDLDVHIQTKQEDKDVRKIINAHLRKSPNHVRFYKNKQDLSVCFSW